MSFDSIRALTTFAIAITGAFVASLWFFWQRYQALEGRFKVIEQALIKAEKNRAEIRHDLQLFRQAEQSNIDRLELMFNGLFERVKHRAERDAARFEKIEEGFAAEIKEVKGYLSRTTDFGIRDRNRD